ncbi:hypothetical protein JD969_12815 [Planctomycetota bacterium]|nr:hypothetical protein JD969_12815 [Planctomycetota bacterium]
MSQRKFKEITGVLAAGIGINIIAILFVVFAIGVRPDGADLNRQGEMWLNNVVDGTSVFALLLFILWITASMILIALSRTRRWACKLHYYLLIAGICIGALFTILGMTAPLFNQPLHIGLILVSPGLFLILAGIMMLLVSRKQRIEVETKMMRTKDIVD